MRAPGGERLVPLRDRLALHLPAALDTSAGAVRIAVATRQGRRTARVSNGHFILATSPAARRDPAAERIPARVQPAASASRWDGCASWPAGARCSSTARAASRSGGAADWVVEELCAGTRYRVRRGRITVSVEGRRKPVKLRTGSSYLVRR